jgi:hypothetical protein
MKVVAHACDEIVERRFVAVHRPLDESSLHPPLLADPFQRTGSGSMSRDLSVSFNGLRELSRQEFLNGRACPIVM